MRTEAGMVETMQTRAVNFTPATIAIVAATLKCKHTSVYVYAAYNFSICYITVTCYSTTPRPQTIHIKAWT